MVTGLLFMVVTNVLLYSAFHHPPDHMVDQYSAPAAVEQPVHKIEMKRATIP